MFEEPRKPRVVDAEVYFQDDEKPSLRIIDQRTKPGSFYIKAKLTTGEEAAIRGPFATRRTAEHKLLLLPANVEVED
jgi:hypothetical protein